MTELNKKTNSSAEQERQQIEPAARVQNALRVIAAHLYQSGQSLPVEERVMRDFDAYLQNREGHADDLREALLTLLQTLPVAENREGHGRIQLRIQCFGAFRVSIGNQTISLRRSG